MSLEEKERVEENREGIAPVVQSLSLKHFRNYDQLDIPLNPGFTIVAGPNAQGKLVRVVKGAIWDVAVDIRRGSPTYGQWAGAELSADNWSQLWCPVGFLHGYCTLTEETEVIYKVTGPYDRSAERGVIWNDPDLKIAWPIAAAEAILSDKDKVLPLLRDCDPWF